VRFRSLAVGAAVLGCAILATAAIALAVSIRPNGVDFRVDSIPASALLAKPATLLVDPDRQAAALRLARWLFPGWIISILAQIVTLAFFWQSGNAARWRDQLRRWTGSSTLVRILFGASLALIARVASIVPEFYIYRVHRTMGLSSQLLHTWSLDWLLNTAISMVATGLVIAIALWLVDRARFWYVYLAAFIVSVSVAIAGFSPYFSAVTAPPLRAQAAIASAQQSARLDVPVVMEVHPNARLGTARVEGIWTRPRVVLGDTVFLVSAPDELRFIVAYELAYVQKGTPLRFALLDALFVILGAAIAVAVADRIGFRRDDDPVSRLALVGALLGVMYMIVLPVDNALQRRMSAEAVSFAIDRTGERAAAVRVAIRAADQRLDEVCPNVINRLFFLTTLDPSQWVETANGVPSGCP
jgi:Zn-dependent protease with chaperone function